MILGKEITWNEVSPGIWTGNRKPLEVSLPPAPPNLSRGVSKEKRGSINHVVNARGAIDKDPEQLMLGFI